MPVRLQEAGRGIHELEFFEVLRRRRSVRVLNTRPITDAQIQRILEAANAAPSAGNLQAYEIYVVTRDRLRESLARAANEQLFIAIAPVVLVFCTHAARSVERYGKRGAQLYALQDATIACTHAMLAITALGLASVWVGAFEPDEIRRIIGAPPGIVPVALLPVGYASEHPKPPGRRPLDELVHRL